MKKFNCIKQIFYISLFLIFMFGHYVQALGQNKFTPDYMISSLLKMRDISTSLELFSSSMLIIEEEKFFKIDQPFMLFLNSSKTEYLIAIIHEGTWKFYFSEFEIGKISDSILTALKIPYIVTKYSNFQTENNVFLGLYLKDVERLKGMNYLRKENRIRYCYNSLNSEFAEYSSCEYYFECELTDDKVTKIRFGYSPL